MSEDTSLLTSLDQPAPPVLAEARDQLFARIEEIFAKSLEDKDVNIAFNVGIQLVQVGSLSGLGLAKLCWLMQAHWEEFDVDSEFVDLAFELWGRTPVYIDRLTAIWDMHETKVAPPEIMDRPIKDQQAIAKMLKQGYELEEEDWQDLVNAPDNQAVLKKIREIKGTEARQSSKLYVVRRSGDLVCYKGEKMLHLGWLATIEEDEEVRDALESFISRSGARKE